MRHRTDEVLVGLRGRDVEGAVRGQGGLAFLGFVLQCIPLCHGRRTTWGIQSNQSHGFVSRNMSSRHSSWFWGFRDHCAIGDEADEGRWGEETEADDQSVFEGLEIRVIETCVDDIEEDGRVCDTLCENVLDRRELGLQFQRHVPRLNVGIIIRQRLARQTKLDTSSTTDPQRFQGLGTS
jgi:hypothetical protein